MWSRAFAVLCASFFLTSSESSAQVLSPSDDLDTRRFLTLGSSQSIAVVVSENPKPRPDTFRTGSCLAAPDQPLLAEACRLVATEAVSLHIPPAVRSFEQTATKNREGTSRLKGTLIGAAIGGGIGSLYGVYYGQGVKDGAEVVAIPVFGGIGAAIGAVTGLMLSW